MNDVRDYSNLKQKAISFRRDGRSYSEILKQVPVAKSTLSLWLREVGLSKRQKQRLTEKKLAAARRGAVAKKERRIALTNLLNEKARKEIKEITPRELWLIGTALYWAEGSKAKEYSPSVGVKFTNSDSAMIKLFLRWVEYVLKVPKENIILEIYLHENNKNRVEEVRRYWARITKFPIDKFNRIYFKKDKIKTNRKNTGDLYYGVLRVNINASSTLNRKITGWINGIVESCGNLK